MARACNRATAPPHAHTWSCRCFGGCEHVDKAENLARERLKLLYGANYANVQPHSGSQANAAVYLALLNPGETILGMGLNEGGHLTHGSPVNFSGKFFNAVHYGTDPDTGMIDYERIAELAEEHRPRLLIGGFSAYSRKVDWARMREIADAYTGAMKVYGTDDMEFNSDHAAKWETSILWTMRPELADVYRLPRDTSVPLEGVGQIVSIF